MVSISTFPTGNDSPFPSVTPRQANQLIHDMLLWSFSAKVLQTVESSCNLLYFIHDDESVCRSNLDTSNSLDGDEDSACCSQVQRAVSFLGSSSQLISANPLAELI